MAALATLFFAPTSAVTDPVVASGCAGLYDPAPTLTGHVFTSDGIGRHYLMWVGFPYNVNDCRDVCLALADTWGCSYYTYSPGSLCFVHKSCTPSNYCGNPSESDDCFTWDSYYLTTLDPTKSPTVSPSMMPTTKPTALPTAMPTKSPSLGPSFSPSMAPSAYPTAEPTSDPTAEPTSDPTSGPTAEPTSDPTAVPTSEPTSDPTAEPTSGPTFGPTSEPTEEPTSEPTNEPSMSPTAEPTNEPLPTSAPTTELGQGNGDGEAKGKQCGGIELMETCIPMAAIAAGSGAFVLLLLVAVYCICQRSKAKTEIAAEGLEAPLSPKTKGGDDGDFVSPKIEVISTKGQWLEDTRNDEDARKVSTLSVA